MRRTALPLAVLIDRNSAEHTGSQVKGGFDAGSPAAGATFTARFVRPGPYRDSSRCVRRCAGVVVVR